MDNCRWVFTASSGRCGTMLLAKLLETVPGVVTQHELKPRIENVWWKLREDPKIATNWLKKHKIPHINHLIQDSNASVYVETSHLMCKGFFEALWQIGIQFEIILLSRNLRKVAMSLYDLHDIPERTVIGRRWYLQPGDSRCISDLPKDHSRLTDYQMCYWYVLEMELRKAQYHTIYVSDKRPVYRVSLEDLTKKEGFGQLLVDMNLPWLTKTQWHLYKILVHERFNNKTSKKGFMKRKGLVDSIIPKIDEQEEEVKTLIKYEELMRKWNY